MSFVDYDDLTERQKTLAHLARPRWERKEFPRFAFFVKPDGTLSKMPGHHRLTKDEMRRTEARIAMEHPAHPEKGDIHHLKTASFTLNKES